MSGNIEQTYIVDERTLSIEEAVAKMIGWMRTEQRILHLSVTEDGIDRNQFIRLYKLPTTLLEIINEERESARLKLFEAVDKWFESTTVPEISPDVTEAFFRIAIEREADLD